MNQNKDLEIIKHNIAVLKTWTVHVTSDTFSGITSAAERMANKIEELENENKKMKNLWRSDKTMSAVLKYLTCLKGNDYASEQILKEVEAVIQEVNCLKTELAMRPNVVRCAECTMHDTPSCFSDCDTNHEDYCSRGVREKDAKALAEALERSQTR